MSQMVEQVSRLIANRLASGGDIYLPNVGSLYVVFQGAEQLSKRWVQPPYRRVDFTSQERGESLVDMIARAASCDADAARAVYDRWLEQTRQDEVLTVAGVGTLKFKSFTPVSEFERRLNPQGRAPMRLRRRGCVDWVMVLGVAAIVAAALVIGYYLMQTHFDRPTEMQIAEVTPTGMSVVPTAPVVADSTTVVRDSAQVAEPIAVPTAEQTAVSASSRPTVGPISTPKQPAESIELSVPVSGRHYVVLGVFQTRENAENAKKLFARRQADLNYAIYRLGDRFMVSCYVSENEMTARNFMREQRETFSELWVYSAR
ncbi:MAG: hypothetical protein NC250_08635 [Alistipes senegalensis]|nr:hypothetical protein [Bacteroides cellulosilyticus]MCM1352779.1 hypothetical protein [Alistipes senegalensis]